MIGLATAFSVSVAAYLTFHHRPSSHRLSLQNWTPLKVEAVEDLADGQTKILSISCPTALLPEPSSSSSRMWIDTVYVKQPELQIQRPYTPLARLPTLATGDSTTPGKAVTIRLLVKAYEDGEVGRYIHSLKPGSTIELRGPERSWEDHSDHGYEEIIFLAGGTGITPFIQLMDMLFSRFASNHTTGQSDFPKVTLVQMAKTGDSLYYNEHIRQWATDLPGNFEFHQVCETSPPTLGMHRRVGAHDLERWIGTGQGTGRIVLVCGPDSMVASMAGSKDPNGYSQGYLQGHLKTLGYSESQVWKM